MPAALDRLAFDELLALQLSMAQAREARAGGSAASVGALTARSSARCWPPCRSTLTGDQRRALDEIVVDLASDQPMRRLLQGDVGSGKTAVAAMALAAVVRPGWQGALMAPTEILARQHFLASPRCSRRLACAPSSCRAHLAPPPRAASTTRSRRGRPRS